MSWQTQKGLDGERQESSGEAYNYMAGPETAAGGQSQKHDERLLKSSPSSTTQLQHIWCSPMWASTALFLGLALVAAAHVRLADGPLPPADQHNNGNSDSDTPDDSVSDGPAMYDDGSVIAAKSQKSNITILL